MSTKNTDPSNSQAQPEQEIPKLSVNFTHRLGHAGDEATPYALNCSVDEMAQRSICLLHLIAGQFCTESDEGKLSDEIIYYSIQGVINEVIDIRETVDCFFKTTHVDSQA